MIRVNNTLIFNFFFLYILLTSMVHFSTAAFIKYPIFLLTFLSIIVLTIYVFKYVRYIPNSLFAIFIAYTFFLVISVLVNLKTTDASFTIKYYGLFIFFLTGYLVNLYNKSHEFSDNKKEKIILGLVIVIPIGIYLMDIYLFNNPESSSLFVNRNNAVLFGIITSYIALVFFHAPKIYFAIIAFNIIIFKTLGALLAAIVSLFIVLFVKNLKIDRLFILASFLVVILAFFFYIFNYTELAIVERLKESIKGFEALFSLSDIQAIVNISYGDMAALSGASDLSFLFRIKHWFSILNIFLQADLVHILFGHGNDSIRYLTSAELRAHNDYIRLLFEVGLLYISVFIFFNLYILKKIGINIYTFPFMIVLMYFFTENLIDNFLAMSLLYYMLGLIVAQKQIGALDL